MNRPGLLLERFGLANSSGSSIPNVDISTLLKRKFERVPALFALHR